MQPLLVAEEVKYPPCSTPLALVRRFYAQLYLLLDLDGRWALLAEQAGQKTHRGGCGAAEAGPWRRL